MKFSIGDRVVAHVTPEGADLMGGDGGIDGLTGVVVIQYCKTVENRFGIKFDVKIKHGHTLGRNCENGYGYWVDERLLSHYNENVTIEDLL